MEQKLQFVIPVMLGLEGLAAEELRRLGMAEVAAENGRVEAVHIDREIDRRITLLQFLTDFSKSVEIELMHIRVFLREKELLPVTAPEAELVDLIITD